MTEKIKLSIPPMTEHDCSQHPICNVGTPNNRIHHAECYCLPRVCPCACPTCNPQTLPGVAKEDVVNRPKHYTSGKIEVIDFIEDQKLGFHLGNTVKYVCRSGKKDPTKTIEDLEKAEWYLKRKIQQLKSSPSSML